MPPGAGLPGRTPAGENGHQLRQARPQARRLHVGRGRSARNRRLPGGGQSGHGLALHGRHPDAARHQPGRRSQPRPRYDPQERRGQPAVRRGQGRHRGRRRPVAGGAHGGDPPVCPADPPLSGHLRAGAGRRYQRRRHADHRHRKRLGRRRVQAGGNGRQPHRRVGRGGGRGDHRPGAAAGDHAPSHRPAAVCPAADAGCTGDHRHHPGLWGRRRSRRPHPERTAAVRAGHRHQRPGGLPLRHLRAARGRVVRALAEARHGDRRLLPGTAQSRRRAPLHPLFHRGRQPAAGIGLLPHPGRARVQLPGGAALGRKLHEHRPHGRLVADRRGGQHLLAGPEPQGRAHPHGAGGLSPERRHDRQ